MQESIAKVVLHSKTQQLLMLILLSFTKSVTVPSDHDAETRASPPLFRANYGNGRSRISE